MALRAARGNDLCWAGAGQGERLAVREIRGEQVELQTIRRQGVFAERATLCAFVTAKRMRFDYRRVS